MEQLESTPLLYPECLRRKWRTHKLRPVWVGMYPGLFRAEDRQHRTQDRYGYGFGDWFISIHLRFRFRNCTVLGSSYFREKDRRFRRAIKIVGEQGMVVIKNIKKHTHTNPPDLLVQPASGKFFFVEVKKDRDKIRPNQRSAFARIETELGCRVIVATLKKTKKLEDSSMPEECKKAFEGCSRRTK